MDAVSRSTVSTASNADLGTVQGAAAMLMLKKSMDAQSTTAAQLIATLPQPALATAGHLGTQVNTYA